MEKQVNALISAWEAKKQLRFNDEMQKDKEIERAELEEERKELDEERGASTARTYDDGEGGEGGGEEEKKKKEKEEKETTSSSNCRRQ